MPMGSRSGRPTGGKPTEDLRPGIRNYMEDMVATLNAGSSVQTVHKGMKSKAFKGAKPNPQQEFAVLNFHCALTEFIDKRYAE